MVPPASHRVPRVRWYSGSCRLKFPFTYRTITYYGSASHPILLENLIAFAVRNPDCIATVGLASFPFARRYLENRFFFLFLRLLRCFSSAGIPPTRYFIYAPVTAHEHSCVSTFGHLRVVRIFAPDRSFSQLITSFIGT